MRVEQIEFFIEQENYQPMKRVTVSVPLTARGDLTDDEYASSIGKQFIEALEDYNINQKTSNKS